MAEFKLEHLSADEVEYELQLRGLPPYSTRVRLANLAERLMMESIGQVPTPSHCLNKNLVAEVNFCFGKLEELEKILVGIAENSSVDGSGKVLISRLTQLKNRINRIVSDDHRLMKQAHGLSQKCAKYVAFLSESLYGKATLSFLLKNEKLVSEMSFLGISTSTKENQVAKGASDMSLSLMESEKVQGKSNSISSRSPADDGGEGLSDPAEVSGIISDDELLSEQGAAGLRTNHQVHDAPQPNEASGLDKIRERYLLKKMQSVANFNPQVEVPLDKRSVGDKRAVEINLDESQRDNQPRFVQQASRDRDVLGQGVEINLNERSLRDNQQRFVQQANRNRDVLNQGVAPVHAEPRPEHRPFPYRNPIPNWNLCFSGDGKGLDVNQFLTQTHLMARADRVSDDELLASAIHLFKGPARNWYMAFETMFDTWNVLKSSLRQSFLSEDGDFLLLKEIEQRRQGKDEPFILYLSTLLNYFKLLKTPLSERQKLDLVTRNMQPYLADRLALTELYDTHHLSMLCKKIEDARDKYKSFRQTEIVAQNQNRRNFYANELSSETTVLQRNVHFQKESCWNCLANDHTFKQCTRPKMRIFCYFCGELGQLAYQCTSCEPKNRPRRPDHFGRDGGKF